MKISKEESIIIVRILLYSLEKCMKVYYQKMKKIR
nr:MAG TPA: hypothetical protein [Bacteriophage sp.]